MGNCTQTASFTGHPEPVRISSMSHEVCIYFENYPDIETVSDASEFLGDTLNTWA
jgi:phage terminase large subunit